jgi:hypothetical protein
LAAAQRNARKGAPEPAGGLAWRHRGANIAAGPQGVNQPAVGDAGEGDSVPIEPTTGPRRWAFLKSLIIVGGSLLAAVYTVANVLALYYAKGLSDRQASAHG